MSKKFKEEVDRIVMNEEMKERILHNVINENTDVKNIKPPIKKHYIIRRKIQIIAACFTLIVCLNVVKSYPQLFRHENENLQQEEISKGTDDKKNDSQDIEKSESYDSNEESNLNENENSSKIEVEDKNPEDSVSNSSTSQKSSEELQSNANTEKVNPVGSVTDYGPIIADYKTLEEAESATKLKINSLKVLPTGFNIDSICVISNEIIQITYSNNEENTITFRAGKDIDNISGDYNIYEVKNLYKINDIDINLEGNKNKVVNLANWKKDNISYSISSIDGLNEEVALNMIKSSL